MMVGCGLFAVVLGFFWGMIVSWFHFEAGVFIGVLIFSFSFRILVNNAKNRKRGLYDH